jgi:predicted nuclease of predicted toxin-antitoxin system
MTAGKLAAGMSHAEIIAGFPELTEDDIRACLAFAAERESRIQDSNFANLSTLLDAPAKVIWLRCGNQPTENERGLSDGRKSVARR